MIEVVIHFHYIFLNDDRCTELSASEVPGEVVGSNEKDLRCRSLLTVCQRRLWLSKAEDTRLE